MPQGFPCLLSHGKRMDKSCLGQSNCTFNWVTGMILEYICVLPATANVRQRKALWQCNVSLNSIHPGDPGAKSRGERKSKLLESYRSHTVPVQNSHVNTGTGLGRKKSCILLSQSTGSRPSVRFVRRLGRSEYNRFFVLIQKPVLQELFGTGTQDSIHRGSTLSLQLFADFPLIISSLPCPDQIVHGFPRMCDTPYPTWMLLNSFRAVHFLLTIDIACSFEASNNYDLSFSFMRAWRSRGS